MQHTRRCMPQKSSVDAVLVACMLRTYSHDLIFLLNAFSVNSLFGCFAFSAMALLFLHFRLQITYSYNEILDVVRHHFCSVKFFLVFVSYDFLNLVFIGFFYYQLFGKIVTIFDFLDLFPVFFSQKTYAISTSSCHDVICFSL